MSFTRAGRHLGLNPLTRGCLVAQAAFLLLTFAVYHARGLSITFDGLAPHRAVVLLVVLAVWVSFLAVPGPRRGWLGAEAAFAYALTLTVTSIALPAQYGALALGRPFVDPALAQADAAIGIDVSAVLAWTLDHPRTLTALLSAYGTLELQLLLAIPIFWLLRDRNALWEFVFHYHVCLVAAVTISALWPVAGPYQWFGYTTPSDLTRVVAQVNGFQAGTMTEVRWAELDGLVSMPSFHTAAGLFLTWAVRKRWWIALPVLVVNSLLILATVFTGIHYAADVFAGGLLFLASMLAYPAVERYLALETPEQAMWAAAPGRELIEKGAR